MDTTSAHLAIFASGGGSNALEIIKYFQYHRTIQVKLLVVNRKNAGAIQHAIENNIPYIFWSKEKWSDQVRTLDILRTYDINGVILAGFLALIPPYLIEEYQDRILNIHPALLPDFGGKGMYGQHVHRAVSQSRKQVTGLTIHLINTHYDEGKILAQCRIPIIAGMDHQNIAAKVLKYEHRLYSPVIEFFFKCISAEKIHPSD